MNAATPLPLIGVFAQLAAHHRALKALLAAACAARTPERRVVRWQQFTAAFDAHQRAEQEVVHPVLTRFEETRPFADGERHAELLGLRHTLDCCSAESDEWSTLLQAFVEAFERHVVEDEDYCFPLALEVLGVERAHLLQQRVSDEGLAA